MRRLAFVVPGLLLGSLAACTSEPGSINVTPLADASWSMGDIYTLGAGAGCAFSAAPVDSKGNAASVTVSVSADDSGIAQVYTTTNPNTFVVVGQGVGTTNVRFSAAGDPPQVIAISVVAQTGP
jgi:hypothetical protein